MTGAETDRLLEDWGTRLLGRRRRSPGKTDGLPMFGRLSARTVRREIRAVVRRAPQVMVKVTGGGRGMGAIRAHLAYISKRGEREIEDENGERQQGRDSIKELARDWRCAGTLIPERSDRREAFNITFSMPRGTEAALVKAAARDVAREEFRGHRYAMVLHEHQENPHVHVVVRAERDDGRRLNPRKADLHRWRERFAGALREYGVEAAATRQAVRGVIRRHERVWERPARAEGRLVKSHSRPVAPALQLNRSEAARHWLMVGQVLSASEVPGDRDLAKDVYEFLAGTRLFAKEIGNALPLKRERGPGQTPDRRDPQIDGPER